MTRRQVRIGGATKAELLRKLTEAGVQINGMGLQLFANDKFLTLDLPTMVDTLQTTVAELGLSDGATFAEITAAAAALELSLCPLELGPHLRLALIDQAEGSAGVQQTRHRAPPGSITVASGPLSDDDEEPKGFYLRRIDGTLWLQGYKSWPGHVWKPEDTFIFVCAR